MPENAFITYPKLLEHLVFDGKTVAVPARYIAYEESMPVHTENDEDLLDSMSKRHMVPVYDILQDFVQSMPLVKLSLANAYWKEERMSMGT